MLKRLFIAYWMNRKLFVSAYSTTPTQCYDPQVDEYYNVGDVWSSSYSGCKLSTCVDIDGILNVERYS